MADETTGTPPPPVPQGPPTGSAASRYFFVLIIGLFAGAMGVVMVLRTIDARKTWEDRFPRAAMQVMNAHLAQLKGTAAANRCAAQAVLPHVQSLRLLANDVEPAFPGLREDIRFAEHARNMRATLDQAIAAPPNACPELEAAIREIDQACRACHQDFRG